MVIKIPQHRNFSHLFTNTDFEETEYSVPGWEISVPRRDDIAWSVVLSYLISTNHRDTEDFARRCKALNVSNKNLKAVKKSINSFNPFRNRYSCFYDETLKNVVTEFKTNLNWKNLTVSYKLKAVSSMLRCTVLLINEKTSKYRFFPENMEKGQNILTLVSKDFTQEEGDTSGTVYNFMLNHRIGIRMKHAALLFFLKEAKIPKKLIKGVSTVAKQSKNFLISILNSVYQSVIPKLYKSAYIISKLSEAGFETDPRTRDSKGLSGLYHALVLGDVKILYKLYYFAANNCFQSGGSFRNPDSRIVSNLLEMEEILVADIAVSENFGHHPNYIDLKKNFDELLRLNKFLIDVNSKIVKIRNKLNYYESTIDTVFEACNRRDIVVSLLDTYKEYFKAVSHGNATISPLDDYVMFKNYYSLIDMATAIIFFDNIIFLKERLSLEDKNQFSEIESSFFFSVLYHVVLDKLNIQDMTETLHPYFQINISSLYIFPLNRRLNNLDKTKQFSRYLVNTIINEEDNVVKCIPKEEIHAILNSYPAFKDSIDLNRLQKYIKTGLTVKISDTKSVLVIERVLQVIGEYIPPETKRDFSFRRFLSLCLPKEVTQILRQIRHTLSNLKSYEFTSKTRCETNLSLFRSIQTEIRYIQNRFKPVYEIQNLNGAICLIKLFEKELEQIRSLPHLYSSSSLEPFYLHEKVDNMVKIIRRLVFEKLQYFYKEIFKMALRSLQEEISDESNWLSNWKDVKDRVLYLLWPLKWLILLLQQYDNDCVATLLDAFHTLENCNDGNNDPINNLKEKTNDFIIRCKDFRSSFLTQSRKIVKPLKAIKNTEHFLKILKGFVYLSHEEMDKIRNEIPESIKQSVSRKEKLIKFIEEGFTLKADAKSPEFEILYLSNKKLKRLIQLYISKDTEAALAILKTPDPIEELEDIFIKNSVKKKKYDSLCKNMQFSDETERNLRKLVAGQREKIPGNSLSNLFDRILLLKKILIEENDEIFNLWIKVKRQTSRLHITDKIVSRYLRDQQLQASVEMLMFDCMNIFRNEKCIENPWIKSSRLYSGINLRNVISHGSPLLESLCTLLDPEDLPSEMIKILIRLIEEEDVIKAILDLYELTNNDFTKLQEILNSEEEDEYCELKDRILKCNDWKNYSFLLPYTRANY